MNTQLTHLPCGMRVLTEFMPQVESVSLGIWLPRGSRDETSAENGMFHFIEHSLFKGTTSRSARQIAEAMDDMGGDLDAFTGKEETCFSFKVRSKHLDSALDILADMLCRPLFDEEELEREKSVIFEEMKMEEDNPEEWTFEMSNRHYWGNHALGRPILGSEDSLNSFDRNRVAAFFYRFFQPGSMIVAAAGKVDHDHICRRLEEWFPRVSVQNECSTHSTSAIRQPPRAHPFQIFRHDNSQEQTHFCMHFAGVSYQSSRYHPLALLCSALGGGMSSRLFQTIREEQGLAYQIGAYAGPFSDCGQITLYGACSPHHLNRALALCLQEISHIKKEGISARELSRAKEQSISQLIMALESSYSRASLQAKWLIYENTQFDPARVIAQIEAVTLDQVKTLAQQLFTDASLGLYASGRFPENDSSRVWSLASA